MSLVIEAGYQGSVARSACKTRPVSTSTTTAGPSAKAEPPAKAALRKAVRRRARPAVMRVSSMQFDPYHCRAIKPSLVAMGRNLDNGLWAVCPGRGLVRQLVQGNPWQDRGKFAS